MSFFDFLKGNKNNKQNFPQATIQSTDNDTFQAPKTSLNMSKEQAISKLNLRKDAMTKLCMTKSNLQGIRARVGVAMDYSGSMEYEYKDGVVQDIVERLLPIGLQFDDNGELDMWLFDDKYKRLPSVTERDFYNYVNREIIEKRYRMGGTNYAPVMRDIMRKYINEEPLDYPSLILFITDGDNSDKKETEAVIREASKHNIFWQFVGVGSGDFDFLEELDEMSGRYLDNANFFPIKNIHNMSDEALYEKLLFEYPSWEKLAKKRGLIR